MPTRADIAMIVAAVIGVAPWAPATAKDGAWEVEPSVSMSRNVENVTLSYKRATDENDTLRITVADCGGDGWSMEDDINTVTADSLRKDIAEEFDNARLNCKLADGVEERLMAGFDEAFAQVKPFLPPHVQTVGGWSIEDRGGQPGDDSERTVTVSKALANIAMVYRPGESGEGASIQLDFKPCKGLNASSGFDFGNPPEDHLKVITEEVAEQYSDFAKDCKTAPEPQAVLMQDFPEALKTVEQWLHDRPFTYPPEPASSDKEQ